MGVDPQQNPSYSNPTAAGQAVATASSSSASVPTTQSRGRKRKLNTGGYDDKSQGYGYDALDTQQTPMELKKQKAKKDADEEKRLRKYDKLFQQQPPSLLQVHVVLIFGPYTQISTQSPLQFRCCA